MEIDSKTVNAVEVLPKDIWTEILSRLAIKDLGCVVSRLSRHFQEMGCSNLCWKGALCRVLHISNRPLAVDALQTAVDEECKGNWKEYCKRLLTMRFLPESAPQELSISENGLVLVQKHSQYSTAVASIGLVAGLYYWEVKLGYCVNGNTTIGVIERPALTSQFHLGYTNDSWGFCHGSGDIWNNMRSQKYGPPSSENDVLGVVLDLREPNNGEIYFFKNGRNLGKAFSGLKGKLFPAVYLYYSQTSATFFPKVFAPSSVLSTLPEAVDNPRPRILESGRSKRMKH